MLEIKPHTVIALPIGQATLCLSNASGTLLETTLGILLISTCQLSLQGLLKQETTKRQISDDVQTRMDTRQERQGNLASHLCEMETRSPAVPCVPTQHRITAGRKGNSKKTSPGL